MLWVCPFCVGQLVDKELPVLEIRSMIDSLSTEKELFSFCCRLNGFPVLVGCVDSLICSIGGIGCLGADGLDHWVTCWYLAESVNLTICCVPWTQLSVLVLGCLCLG